MNKCIGLVLALVLISCGSSSSNSTVTIKGGATTSGSNNSILPAQTASELKLKVYKVAASTSPLCTNPVTIFEVDEEDAEYENFLGNPTLGTGELADGTYHCLSFEISDVLKYKPTENEGECVADQEYELEICRDFGGEDDETYEFQLIDGTTGTCANGEQRIGMYLSTYSAGEGGESDANAFMPPTEDGDETQGLKMNGAFEVSGSTSATFVADGTNAVETSGDGCDHQPPIFSVE